MLVNESYAGVVCPHCAERILADDQPDLGDGDMVLVLWGGHPPSGCLAAKAEKGLDM